MISFIVATIGRPSLIETLKSIDCYPSDEILVIGNATSQMTGDPRPRYFRMGPGNDWGATERNFGISRSRGKYLAFMDDDDIYAPSARLAFGMAILSTPNRPMIFKMRYPNGATLWEKQELKCGNVGTPMMLIPNDVNKLGRWSSRRECDFDFLASCQWKADEYVWRNEVVALIGHNDGASLG